MKEALEQIRSIHADIYELRLDLFSSYDLEILRQLKVPMILKGAGPQKGSKKILSHHNFEKTPELDPILERMKKKPATYYKIATFANSILDTMRVLLLQKQVGSSLIAIAMGPLGQPSRILAPIFGAPICYASINEQSQTAPGQLSLGQLEKYKVNRETKIFGLIGDPVEQSISHHTHNALFKELGMNAVYVKFKVTSEELPAFLEMAKKLDFCGLSVTAPLKEAILPFLDIVDPSAETIGAVNTLNFINGSLHGFNTDQMGAKNVLQKHLHLQDKKVQIYGAGGAAKALVQACLELGATVAIQNRTSEKAFEMTTKFKCTVEHFHNCDLAINCTASDFPVHAPVAMDIKYNPKETLFLKDKQKIYGIEMFIEQAVGQFSIWFGPNVKYREILTREAHAGIDGSL